MKKEFIEKLRSYSERSIKYVSKYIDIKNLKFDHICYQTMSKKDYKKALRELKSEITFINEIPHAGRMLTVAKLNKSINVNGIHVDRIEISEPKPKSIILKRNFDHFSFYVEEDFDKVLDLLKEKGIKIYEVKQIGTHRFFKFTDGEVEIELRNKRLGKEVGIEEEDKMKISKGDKKEKKQIENYEDDLRKEKEKRLRALADYQNLQKRIEKERNDLSYESNAEFLRQLLDVLDDLDRAIENFNVDEKDQVGIRMVREKIKKIIDNGGLKEIKCKKGDHMDPNIFEAVGIVAVESGKDENKVVEIVQKGYIMSSTSNVVRPVRVIIGKVSEENKK